MRADFRENNQIRPLESDNGFMPQVDGSGRFSIGNTSVVASVLGPASPKFSHQDTFSGGILDVRFQPSSGRSTPYTLSLEVELHQLLSSVVLLEAYPHDMSSIVVQEGMDDGSLFPCCVHACILALIDANIEMKAILAGVTIAVPLSAISDRENEEEGEEEDTPEISSRVFVDPTFTEEHTSQTGLFTAFFVSSTSSSTTNSSTTNTTSTTMNKRLQSVYHTYTGVPSLSSSQFTEMMQVAKSSSSIFHAYFLRFLEAQFKAESLVHGLIEEQL